MIIDITPQNIQEELVAASQTKPVLVYLCDSRDPQASEYEGKLQSAVGVSEAIKLTRVDLTKPELSGLAYQFGIQAVPALAILQGGRIVDLVQGQEAADPKAFIEQFLPKEDETLIEQAHELMAEGNFSSALEKADAALLLANKAKYRALKAMLLVKLGKLDEAQAIIETASMEDKLDAGEMFAETASELDLARKALADSPIEDIKRKFEENPEDLDLAIELAIQYNALGKKSEALDCLLKVLKKNLDYKDAKKTYLDIIATMGKDAAASAYRRKLYTLLH